MTGINKLILATILVNDLDVALDFYKNKLGFVLKHDLQSSDGDRWLTVAPQNQKELEIVLRKPRADKHELVTKEFEFSSTAATLATRVDEALNLIPALRGTDTTIAVVPGAAGTDFTLIDITITGSGGGKLLEILPANTSADRYVTVDASIAEFDVIEPAWSYPTYVLHWFQ